MCIIIWDGAIIGVYTKEKIINTYPPLFKSAPAQWRAGADFVCAPWARYKVQKLNQLIRGWINYFKIGSMKRLCTQGVSLVKLIEPPCTERYARWCERPVGEIIAYLLLD
ncbi:group II intron maturase-specific domain-containing protein [Enterocloster clostridioformis]|uniref:group II intron maturase-specific domain-containing protein n=1 Tax=Enterocloster clostridioformis TaxID=1531 RepID=UPI00048639BC